jgi:rhodanese-related sulfurtransferase
MKSVRYQVLVMSLLTAVAAGTGACSSSDSDTVKTGSSSTKAPSTSAAAVKHLDPKAFGETLKQPGTVVLDVRTPEEFAEGHIPNAKNLDVQASDFANQLKSLDKTVSYAVYCRSGKRSAAAADQMHTAGFTKVVDLAGGVVAWTAAGSQLTTS